MHSDSLLVKTDHRMIIPEQLKLLLSSDWTTGFSRGRIGAGLLRISRHATHLTLNDESYSWWVDSRKGAQPSQGVEFRGLIGRGQR